MNDTYIFAVGVGVFGLMLGYIYICLSIMRKMANRDDKIDAQTRQENLQK